MSRILPILFNTEMVRAILDGRKTVTRRICKDGNDYVVPDMSFYDDNKRTYAVHNYADYEHEDKLSIVERTCPICPGDILYVRETWATLGRCYVYKSDNPNFPCCWHPSIHMPKEAARIWLKCTEVRVERLQEITDDQAEREGCFDYTSTANGFFYIWDSTIKKSALDRYGWDANPWVWVIEFERCEKPENKIL